MIALAPIPALLQRVPKPVWYSLLAGLVLLLVWRWHDIKVDAVFAAGAAGQAAVDAQRVSAAAEAAQAAQRLLKAGLAVRQAKVTKGTDHALLAQNADLARRYDDLRLRWAAHRTDPGGASTGGAASVSGTATGADDTACAAAGWVSFDAAAAAAEAADTAIARDDAWRGWVMAQAMAWPKD